MAEEACDIDRDIPDYTCPAINELIALAKGAQRTWQETARRLDNKTVGEEELDATFDLIVESAEELRRENSVLRDCAERGVRALQDNESELYGLRQRIRDLESDVSSLKREIDDLHHDLANARRELDRARYGRRF